MIKQSKQKPFTFHLSPFTFAGFTLIEILIAVGILAGSAGILLSQVEMSARLSAKDEALVRAVTLANNKMIEIQGDLQDDIKKGLLLDEESESGEFDEPFEDYAWTYEIKKIEIPTTESSTEGQSARVAGVMKNISKEISKSVRQLRLSVSWGEHENKDGEMEPYTFDLTTHIVMMP